MSSGATPLLKQQHRPLGFRPDSELHVRSVVEQLVLHPIVRHVAEHKVADVGAIVGADDPDRIALIIDGLVSDGLALRDEGSLRLP